MQFNVIPRTLFFWGLTLVQRINLAYCKPHEEGRSYK